MERFKISSTLEDYLEAIAELISGKGHAHATDVAQKLNVRVSSATDVLKTLSSKGFVKYQSYEPVILTDAGAETAAVIRHRHQALKNFFEEILKIEEDEADDAACKLEHILTDKAIARIALLSGVIESNDFCSGLRGYLEKTMQRISPDDLKAGHITLDKLPEGRRGVVVRVGTGMKGLRKFADLGIVRGTVIEMEGGAPFGDLIRIRVLGSSLTLRRSDAAYIWIKPALPLGEAKA